MLVGSIVTGLMVGFLMAVMQVRADLGDAFATERKKLVDDDCGAIANVRRIVARARKEGLLDDSDDDEGVK